MTDDMINNWYLGKIMFDRKKINICRYVCSHCGKTIEVVGYDPDKDDRDQLINSINRMFFSHKCNEKTVGIAYLKSIYKTDKVDDSFQPYEIHT